MSGTEVASSAPLYEFDRATNTTYVGKTSRGTHLYAGTASPDWCIGSVPHGGYVLALVTDAVLRLYSTRYQKDPVALNCFYLRKTDIKPFVVEVQDVKTSSKGYCVVRASLLQPKSDEEGVLTHVDAYDVSEYIEKVQTVFTMGNMDAEEGVTNFYEPYQAPNRERMTPFKHAFMGDFLIGKLDHSNIPSEGKAQGTPEFHQSLQFSDGRPIDFKSMPYWCDMFVTPPILLGQEVLGGPVWCPTMQLEVQFKRKPKPEDKEVLTSIVAPHIINGRFDCSGGVWDKDGTLLALTRHQCLIVPWSRNTKTVAPKARF